MHTRASIMLGISVLCSVFGIAIGADYSVRVIEPAVNNHVILRDGPLPSIAKESSVIQLRACPGEFESGAFVVSAAERLDGVRIEFGALTGPGGVWPKDAVNIRVVKEFYRGTPWGQMVLPTLLVHDENFLAIEPNPTPENPNGMKNVGNGALRDAAELQPVAIEGNKQFWITVRVPRNAKAGIYETKMRVVPAGNGQATEMSLQVEVYPFELEAPMLEYSIYNPTQLLMEGEKPEGFHQISADQFRKEMRNMLDHGVTNPNIYWSLDADSDGTVDFSRLEEVLKVRESAGMHAPDIYLVTHPILFTDRPLTEAERERTRKHVTEINAWAQQRGYREVRFMANDEWWGEQLTRERDSIAAVGEAGGRVYTSVMQTPFFNQIGDVLHQPIMLSNISNHMEAAMLRYPPEQRIQHLDEIALASGFENMSRSEEYRKVIDGVHRLGNKIYTYMNPLGGDPLPDWQRRNEGLGLWRVGFDGSMTWAYIHYVTTAIDPVQQPVAMASIFRTDDGVLDTLHWEGFREGVDDVRYLTTLFTTLSQVAGRFPNDPLVVETLNWVREVDVARGNLDTIRAEMARRTIALLDLGARDLPPEQLLAGMNVQEIRVTTFPEPWRFKVDPDDRGQTENWFDPGIDAQSWAEVRTDQQLGWDKQGFAEQAVGFGWYRAAVPLTEGDRAKQFKYLYFEAVDEDAWVYLNGEKIFDHTIESTGLVFSELWLTPFVVPLSDVTLRGDGNDVLVVRVLNRGGMGGIWKPVHLISSDQELSKDQIRALLSVRLP